MQITKKKIASATEILDKNNVIFKDETIDGYFWSGVNGAKEENYLELPDGYWVKGVFSEKFKNTNKYVWEKHIENSKIEGKVVVYDNGNKIKEEAEYKEGLRNGITVHYRNEMVSSILYYKKGIFIENIGFGGNGHINYSCTVNENRKSWNEKGILIGYEDIDSNLMCHGKWIEYYNNGAEKESGQCRHGKKYGTYYFYKENGTLDKEEVWDNGQLVREILHNK